MQGVYAIRHTATGRYYIGSSVNIERRWKEHRMRLKSGKHPCIHLLNAWRKYGPDAFEFMVLEQCDDWSKDTQVERENYWIDKLKPEFNLAPVAGSVLGLVRSDEVRKRMSTAQKGRPSQLKGRPRTPEARDAISAGKKGKHHSPEHLANLSAALKGRISPRKGVTLSQETRDRISESKTGAKQPLEAVLARAAKIRGQVRTEEQRKRMSVARKGVPLTPEHRAKLSEAAKARAARKKLATTGI